MLFVEWIIFEISKHTSLKNSMTVTCKLYMTLKHFAWQPRAHSYLFIGRFLVIPTKTDKKEKLKRETWWESIRTHNVCAKVVHAIDKYMMIYDALYIFIVIENKE